MDLGGKVAVVTGGGNGIGRQVALELLRRGVRVAAVDIRAEGLDETVRSAAAGDRLVTFVADIPIATLSGRCRRRSSMPMAQWMW